MQKNYSKFKIFTFILSIISLDAMDDFERLGFESPVEQFSLITQKNNKTIFENIDLEGSHFWPTPLYAGLYSLPYIFLTATIETLIAHTDQTDSFFKKLCENGFLKNWGLLSLGSIILYSTNPFIVFDSACHIYNFIKFNRNKQKYEYQYNRKIKSLHNSSCIINMHVANEKNNYPSYKTTKNKIINFFFHHGFAISIIKLHHSVVSFKENTIVFNDLPPHENDENVVEDIIDEMIENSIENASKKEIKIKGVRLAIKISSNESIKIVYKEDRDCNERKFFILDTLENNMYPLLPNEEIDDVRITPDKKTLIAITPTKTIKIDLTKDLDLTKEQLEKELCSKNRKEKLIRITNKSAWLLLFLGYSQWWLNYFFKINMYQNTKQACSLLKERAPVLLSLPPYGIQYIISTIKNIKLKNIGITIFEFLFGKSKI